MFEYPLVYRSGGWVPTKPREVEPYKNGRISVPLEHPDVQKLSKYRFRRAARGSTGRVLVYAALIGPDDKDVIVLTRRKSHETAKR